MAALNEMALKNAARETQGQCPAADAIMPQREKTIVSSLSAPLAVMRARMTRLPGGPAFYTLAGRSLQFAAQLALVLIVPKLLPPAEYVQFNLLLPVALLGASMIFGWFTGATYRYVHALLAADDDRQRRTACFYYGLLSVSLVLIYAVSSLFTASIYPLLLILLAASGLKTGVLSVLNAAERHGGFFWANLCFAASLAIFLGLCALVPAWGLPRILACYAALDSAIAAVAWNRLGIFTLRAPPRFDAETGRRYFRYGMPLVANTLAVWVVSLSDRYFLALWESTPQVAGYILSYQLGSNVVTIPLAFAVTVIFPKILRLERDAGHEAALAYTYRLLGRYLRYMVILSVLGGGAVILFLHLFYPSYETDPWVVMLIVLAHAIFGLTHFYNKEFELDGRTIVITQSIGLAAVVNVALNLALIPLLGGLGAAISTLAAYCASTFFIYRVRAYRPA